MTVHAHIESMQASTAKLVDVKVGKELDMPLPEDQFMDGLELILTKMIEGISADPDKSSKTSGFYSARAPRISIKSYLKRIHHFFACSDECFVLALVYIDRIAKRAPAIILCDRSVHRVLFFSMMLAAKFHDDVSYSNKYYAKVGGMPVSEVNTLELEILTMLNWKMIVQPKDYHLYHSFLCGAASRGLSLQTHSEPEPEPSSRMSI